MATVRSLERAGLVRRSSFTSAVADGLRSRIAAYVRSALKSTTTAAAPEGSRCLPPTTATVPGEAPLSRSSTRSESPSIAEPATTASVDARNSQKVGRSPRKPRTTVSAEAGTASATSSPASSLVIWSVSSATVRPT
jgi:hypothetical protein